MYVVAYNKKEDEFGVKISNPLIKEERTYGKQNPVPFDEGNLNVIAENFLVFNYLVSERSIFKRNSADPIKTHALLTNIDRAFAGQGATKSVREIISEDEYAKAIAKAKRAFDKEQQSTIDSQTPEPI